LCLGLQIKQLSYSICIVFDNKIK